MNNTLPYHERLWEIMRKVSDMACVTAIGAGDRETNYEVFNGVVCDHLFTIYSEMATLCKDLENIT